MEMSILAALKVFIDHREIFVSLFKHRRDLVQLLPPLSEKAQEILRMLVVMFLLLGCWQISTIYFTDRQHSFEWWLLAEVQIRSMLMEDVHDQGLRARFRAAFGPLDVLRNTPDDGGQEEPVNSMASDVDSDSGPDTTPESDEELANMNLPRIMEHAEKSGVTIEQSCSDNICTKNIMVLSDSGGGTAGRATGNVDLDASKHDD
jgi:ferredoxin